MSCQTQESVSITKNKRIRGNYTITHPNLLQYINQNLPPNDTTTLLWIEDIYFDLDKANINVKNQPKLAHIASLIQGHPDDYQLILKGLYPKGQFTRIPLHYIRSKNIRKFLFSNYSISSDKIVLASKKNSVIKEAVEVYVKRCNYSSTIDG